MNKSHPSVVLGLHHLSVALNQCDFNNIPKSLPNGVVTHNSKIQAVVLAIAQSAYTAGQDDIRAEINEKVFYPKDLSYMKFFPPAEEE